MLVSEIKKINKVRLREWNSILTENQATAFCLIGVEHNSGCGTLRVCVCEGIPEATVAKFLRGAADEIDP